MRIHRPRWIKKQEISLISVSLGEMPRGPNQFQTGFYGLKDLPAEFQKVIDLRRTNRTITYAYLDDILIITKGPIEKHRETLEKVPRSLDEENFAISMEKCKFAFNQIEWLGFLIDCEETNPL